MPRLPEYHNEPYLDFTIPANRDAQIKALAEVRGTFDSYYPLVIGERRIDGATFDSVNPANPSEVIGHVVDGTREQVELAIQAAESAFQSWRFTPVETRAGYLFRAAAEMRRRKTEFNAYLVLEVGKSWAEAEAETAESIDFMEYYARQMLKLAHASDILAEFPGEALDLRYIPLGVGAVIPPWNFPNAILAGMTSAAIVAGNTVVLKPSPLAPVVGYKVCELFWSQGLPPGVLNYLPGPALEVGEALVDHPRTRFIAFTGSQAVGVRINERAAKIQPGQIWLKRAILEMGGKDAVVVDETADLTAAAEGIVASAFGFGGQKCSAGSRAILVNESYEQVCEMVCDRASKLTVDAPERGANVYMGPVADSKFRDKIMNYIGIGKEEGQLLIGGDAIETPEQGYFIQPTIFGEVPDRARIAQEEIFGPVLSLIRAQDYTDALRIANGTIYGLTGALYSRDRERLEQARREFHVGNLYLNRKSTGAMVGVHPFGGFNMSGTDSKAGGPDYLLLFTQAKSTAERL